MNLKTAFVGLAAAALLAPVGALITAGPASADNDVIHIRLDPASGWTWSGTVYAFNTSGLVTSKEFTVGPGGGLQDVLDVTVDSLTNYSFWVYDSTLTGGGVTRKVDIQAWVHNDAFQDLYLSTQVSKGDVPMAANLGKFGSDDYELKFYPATNAPSLQSLSATAAAAFDGGSGCTVKGTAGDNVLTGTAGDDVICGFGGNDTILGKGGNDVIHAGGGHDTIHAGDGHDTVVGGNGNDTIHGGEGADDISGGKGKDTIHHTKGHDWAHGGKHKDKLVNVGGRP
jgi:Ca2+-binding RTX toxin-like protein